MTHAHARLFLAAALIALPAPAWATVVPPYLVVAPPAAATTPAIDAPAGSLAVMAAGLPLPGGTSAVPLMGAAVDVAPFAGVTVGVAAARVFLDEGLGARVAARVTPPGAFQAGVVLAGGMTWDRGSLSAGRSFAWVQPALAMAWHPLGTPGVALRGTIGPAFNLSGGPFSTGASSFVAVPLPSVELAIPVGGSALDLMVGTAGVGVRGWLGAGGR